MRHSNWSIIKETHRQPIKCEPWMSQQNLKILKIWKFASKTMAGVLSRFSFATAAEKQLKQWKHWKSTAFWLLVWKNWCLEKGIAKEIKITSQPSLTLCSSDPTPKLKTNMVNPRKQWFHFIESDLDTDWTIPWTV